MHKYLDKIKYFFAKKQNTQMFRIKFILKLLFIVNKNCICYSKNEFYQKNGRPTSWTTTTRLNQFKKLKVVWVI